MTYRIPGHWNPSTSSGFFVPGGRGENMIDIAVRELNKYYGSNHVIKGISFEIKNGEKVGLLGKNGSGKTTIFKILAGIEEYESGDVIEASGKKIEVLEQIPVFEEKLSVERVLQTAFEEIFDLADEMNKLENIIQTNYSPKLLTRYGQLQTRYEALGGYEFDSRIDRICNGMNININMRNQLFSTLSGGEKTRVNLARILLKNADILLLDEPTNHLDLISLQWLERYLESYTGTVVIISHDRCFLDNVVSRIFEIEDGKASFYEGNYSYYVVEKEKRFCLQAERYEQQQRKIGQLEAAAKRMHEWAQNADNPNMHRRAFSVEKRIERIERIDKPFVAKKLTAEFEDSSFSGNEIITFKDVGKGCDNKKLFHEVNLKILKNDRIAVLGDNGCGKSTLIKLLMGKEIPDEGEILCSNSLKAAYMPQTIEFDNCEASIMDTLRYFLEINEEKARNILAKFNFRGKDVFKQVGMLSGGEKSRLKLCMLMQNDSNLLVLDEPTNHLDISSREWIEDAVFQYEGSILFISHDRYFLNKFSNRIWDMFGGKITDFNGTFSDYCEWKERISVGYEVQKSGISEKISVKDAKERNKEQNKERDKERGKKEAKVEAKVKVIKKETKDLENKINQEESRLKEIEICMGNSTSDFEQLNLLYSEKIDIERRLEALYVEWAENSNGL